MIDSLEDFDPAKPHIDCSQQHKVGARRRRVFSKRPVYNNMGSRKLEAGNGPATILSYRALRRIDKAFNLQASPTRHRVELHLFVSLTERKTPK